MDKPKRPRAPAVAPAPRVILHLGLRLQKCSHTLPANPDLCCATDRILQGQPPCIKGYVCDRCLWSENNPAYEKYRCSSAKADFSKATKKLPVAVVLEYAKEIKKHYGWDIDVSLREPDECEFQASMTITKYDTPVPRLTEAQVTVIQALGIHDVPWPELKQRITDGLIAVQAPLLSLDCFLEDSQDESVPATPVTSSPGRRKRPKPEGWIRMKIPDKYANISVVAATYHYLPLGPGGGQRVKVFLANGEELKMTKNMFFTLSERDLGSAPDEEAVTSASTAEPAKKRAITYVQQHDVAALAGNRATTSAPTTINVVPRIAAPTAATVQSPSRQRESTVTVRSRHNTRQRHQPPTSTVTQAALHGMQTPDRRYTMHKYFREQCDTTELAHPDPTVTSSPDTPMRQLVAERSQQVARQPVQATYWGQQQYAPQQPWGQATPWPPAPADNDFKHPAHYATYFAQQQQAQPLAARHAALRQEAQQQERERELLRRGDRSIMRRKLVERQSIKKEREDSFTYRVGSQGYAEQQDRKLSAALSQITEAEDADDVIYSRAFAYFKYQNELPLVWQGLGHTTPIPVVDDDRTAKLRPVSSALVQYYGLPIKATMSQRLLATFNELYQSDNYAAVGTAAKTDVNHVSATPYAAPHGDTVLTSVNPLTNRTGPDWLPQPTDKSTAPFSWPGVRMMGMIGVKGFRVANFLSTVAEAVECRLPTENLSDPTRRLLKMLMEIINDNGMVWTEMYSMTLVQQRDFLLLLSGKKDFTEDELRDLRYYAPNYSDSVFPRTMMGGGVDPLEPRPVPSPPDVALMRDADVDVSGSNDAFENIDANAADASSILFGVSSLAATSTPRVVATTATAVRPTATATTSTPAATPEPMDIGQVAAQVAGIPGAGALPTSSSIDDIISRVATPVTSSAATPAVSAPALSSPAPVSNANTPATPSNTMFKLATSGSEVTTPATTSNASVATTAAIVSSSLAATPVTRTLATAAVLPVRQPATSQAKPSPATSTVVRLPDEVDIIHVVSEQDVAASDITASEEEEQEQSDTEVPADNDAPPVFHVNDGLSDEDEEFDADVDADADTEEVIETRARYSGKAGSMYQAMCSSDK